jgi:hypothetical protein
MSLFVKDNPVPIVQIESRSNPVKHTFFNGSGNFGIGTSAPAAKLDVAGAIAVSGQTAVSYTKTTNTFNIGDLGNGDDAAAGGTGDNVAFFTRDTEVGRFNQYGYFGLWTNNPLSELEIHDSPKDADPNADLRLIGSSSGGGVLRFYDGSNERATIRSDATQGDLVFQTGGASPNGPSEHMRITAAGNLKMSGTVEAGTIKTNVWTVAPDYVFEKDYKLNSLEHVERYVNENKHLPEIPSAKEIKENGLDLAEMNLKLLKKVEELTLYAIKQEKRDRMREQEISDLKKSIADLRNGSR